MLRALIVSPNDVSDLVAALAEGGMTALVSRGDGTTEELCRVCDNRLPDLVIADLRRALDPLPLRHLRRRITDAWHDEGGANVPPVLVLFSTRHLTARDWLPLVDDFLAPPHDPVELLARLRALLFRRRQIENGDIVRFSDVLLDIAGGTARHSESQEPIPLTPREWDLLRFLLTHRGKLFSRERLLDLVWGVDYSGGARTVDIHIRRLRTKLPPEAATLLENRRGLGYGFVSQTPNPQADVK